LVRPAAKAVRHTYFQMGSDSAPPQPVQAGISTLRLSLVKPTIFELVRRWSEGCHKHSFVSSVSQHAIAKPLDHLLESTRALIRQHLSLDPLDWAMWLRSAGIDGVDPHRGPTFLSSDHAIQAAIRGEGVVLG
jgi:hypothetical protein